MTRYAIATTLFQLRENPTKSDTPYDGWHLYLTTDDGRRWQIQTRRAGLNVTASSVNTGEEYTDYSNARRVFNAIILKLSREKSLAELPGLTPIPDGWEPIEAPTLDIGVIEPRLIHVINDPEWVFIPIYTFHVGRLQVRGRSVSFQHTRFGAADSDSLPKQLAPDLYSKVGGDFVITAGTDDFESFAAYDLVEEMCLSTNADFDERLAVLRDLVAEIPSIAVIPYVSDAERKRTVAHEYIQDHIPTLFARTRCPINQLRETEPPTQLSFRK